MFAIVATVTVVVTTALLDALPISATVTVPCTVAAGLLLVSVTTAPPADAAALSVTVPVLFAGPVRLPGFSVIEVSTGTIYPPAGSGCTAPAIGRGLGAGGTGKSNCGAHKRHSL